MDCPVCFNPFDVKNTIPKILNCGHTFCLNCLNNINVCPQCRQRSLGDSPVSLSTNFRAFMISPKDNLYIGSPLAVKEEDDVPEEKCPMHPSKTIQRFCKDCSKFICFHCKYQSHENHRLRRIDTEFCKYHLK